MKNEKKYNFSIFRLIIVLILFIPIIYNEYQNHKYQILYSSFLYGPLYLLCLVLFVIIIIFDAFLFLSKRNLKNFTPTFIGIILILISSSIYIYHNYKIHQKSIFKAVSNSIVLKNDIETKYNIDFKKNQNYVIEEFIDQGLLTNYYYGKFNKIDSIYILDGEFGENNISNRFVIRKIKNKDKVEKQLIQLNQKNIDIQNGFQFIVR